MIGGVTSAGLGKVVWRSGEADFLLITIGIESRKRGCHMDGTGWQPLVTGMGQVEDVERIGAYSPNFIAFRMMSAKWSLQYSKSNGSPRLSVPARSLGAVRWCLSDGVGERHRAWLSATTAAPAVHPVRSFPERRIENKLKARPRRPNY